jgi:hypothetical protein
MNGADKPDSAAADILPRTGELNMSDKNQGKNRQSGKAPRSGDTDASLQKELGRETAEGRDSVGDVGSNRNLTGSSTWETLPSGKKKTPDSSAAKGKTPKRPR